MNMKMKSTSNRGEQWNKILCINKKALLNERWLLISSIEIVFVLQISFYIKIKAIYLKTGWRADELTG